MAFYESVFIARQDVSTSQVDGLTDTFEKIIKDLGGSVTKKESWGLRTMAYRVKKNRKGHYVLMNIDAPADAIKEMERQMNLNEDVIRHLTTRVDELEEGPSAVLKAKERGDDRGRRPGHDGDYEKRPSFNKGPDKDAKADKAPDDKADKAPDDKADKAPDDKADKAPDDKAGDDDSKPKDDKAGKAGDDDSKPKNDKAGKAGDEKAEGGDE